MRDGGALFAMGYIYWPVSVLVSMAEEMLPKEFADGLPLYLCDSLGCLLIGTGYYYLLVKVVHWGIRRLKGGSDRSGESSV
jgi:hypothetical protein